MLFFSDCFYLGLLVNYTVPQYNFFFFYLCLVIYWFLKPINMSFSKFGKVSACFLPNTFISHSFCFFPHLELQLYVILPPPPPPPIPRLVYFFFNHFLSSWDWIISIALLSFWGSFLCNLYSDSNFIYDILFFNSKISICSLFPIFSISGWDYFFFHLLWA